MKVVGLAIVATVLVVMTAAAVWSRRSARYAVVDAAWGAAFAAAAIAAAFTASLAIDSNDSVIRRWLLAGLVACWGLRLAWHLGRRVIRSEHDDPRYEQLLGGTFQSVRFGQVILKVFALQGLLVIAIAAPLLPGTSQPVAAWWPVGAGVLVWVLGFAFEAVGDMQLETYKAGSDRPSILNTGLWAWTRHPNYFGDACIWWGIWLIGGAASGPVAAVATLISPVLMTWFLTAVSGVRLAEQRMAGREGWAAYAVRTPVFFPRRPRHPLGN